MTRPKDIGTAAETAVVRYLRTAGFPHAERRALAGTHDLGDIVGTPGVCWEVKGGKAAKTASDGQVAAWLGETERERRNAGADVGVLVMARSGIGPANAGRWWAVLDGWHAAWFTGGVYTWHYPIRLQLADVAAALICAGYGDGSAVTLTREEAS
jgi:hypothetical protein